MTRDDLFGYVTFSYLGFHGALSDTERLTVRIIGCSS